MKLSNAAGVIALLVGCGPFGDGRAETSTRTVGAFTAVEADTALDVVITRGDAISVVVTTDDNLVDSITTVVVGNTLKIQQTSDIHPRAAGGVAITVPDLVAADANGSGSMTVSGFTESSMHLGNGGSGVLDANVTASALDLVAAGSGKSTVRGATDGLTLSLPGSGDVDASKLVAHGATLDLPGSGDASIVVVGNSKLTTSGSGGIVAQLDDGTAAFVVAGSGDIRWSGNAQVVSQSRTGSGNIVHE